MRHNYATASKLIMQEAENPITTQCAIIKYQITMEHLFLQVMFATIQKKQQQLQNMYGF